MTTLPEPVRARVVALASEHLGSVPPELVPIALRAVARFTPAKRARFGGTAIAAALEGDAVFRRGVMDRATAQHPDLVAALKAGTAVPAAPPEEVAALAYLLRIAGWQERIAAVAADLQQRRESDAGAAQLDAVQRLTEQLQSVRTSGREQLAAAREELQVATSELTTLRRKVREMGDRAGRAEQAQRTAEAATRAATRELDVLREGRTAELRALEERLAGAERAAEQARQAVREGFKGDQLRLRLLLDALVGAAQGLRRELALAPADGRPADALTPDYEVTAPELQGRSDADPALLDALLGVPTTHLLIDGYNVTKTAYPSLALEAQRTRLLAGLSGLAARTGAEVTVIFDGSDGAMPVKVAAPRGVRLIFSRTGETADEVLRRYVRNEPQGRPVVVVSSDREVADGVRRSGARAVPSVALVGLLERGTVRGGA